MSLALALEGLAEYLKLTVPGLGGSDRDKRVGVHEDGLPPAWVRSYYVSIDETSVSVDDASNYWLGEDLDISVYVIRNVSWLPREYKGKALFKDQPYLSSALTMEDIERDVLNAIHQRFEFVTFLNDRFGLPGDLGDIYQTPLAYRGRQKTRDFTPPEVTDASSVFKGRELRFQGLRRIQTVGCVE